MKPYITIIWKAVGITYLCEFAAGISRDCGNSMIAAQIETGGKIAVLLLGMPVLGTLLETITNFL
jgi:stage III sporulation protein AD